MLLDGNKKSRLTKSGHKKCITKYNSTVKINDIKMQDNNFHFKIDREVKGNKGQNTKNNEDKIKTLKMENLKKRKLSKL